jgi:hypothetical protein
MLLDEDEGRPDSGQDDFLIVKAILCKERTHRGKACRTCVAQVSRLHILLTMLRSALLLETTALGQNGLGQIPLFLSGLDPQVQSMAVDRIHGR